MSLDIGHRKGKYIYKGYISIRMRGRYEERGCMRRRAGER
jgi:hypothetical protein